MLQIDAPDLAMERTMMFQDLSRRGLPRRSASCMSSDQQARSRASRATACGCMSAGATGKVRTSHDMPLATDPADALHSERRRAVDRVRQPAPRARIRGDPSSTRCPKDMILIPGVIETTSNFVEHPEVVARRIEEAVAVVGDRERVIASTDCGFGTFTGREWVAELGGVEEAQIAARGRRYRVGAAVGEAERGVTITPGSAVPPDRRPCGARSPGLQSPMRPRRRAGTTL